TFSQLTGNKALLQTVGVNRLTESRNRSFYNALNVYGTYNTNLENHHFKLLLGYNHEDYESDNILAEQGGLLFNDLANLNLGTDLLRADGSASIWAIKGYFGRFNYDFKNKYLLEVNARYDGSSRFPKESRWGLFPSVSAGWYVSREKFWEPIRRVVSSFKLRTSYGKLGNQNVGLYTFSQILGLGQTTWLNNGTRLNYAGLPAPLPSAVSWESTRTVDLGVDLAFFNNRLTASFDWYEKNTSEMYLPGEPLPAVFGAAEPKENIASLRNRGFEFSLGYTNKFTVAGSPLNFKATASIYNFEGVITKYPNPNGVMSTYWERQKLGQIWGYHIDGQFQSDKEASDYQNSFANPSRDLGKVYKYIINTVQNTEWKGLKAGDVKYVDLDGDGSIDKGEYTLADHGDLRPIGNAMPQFPFGFSIMADWKGFDLSIAGTGVSRQDWYPTGDIFWGPYERPYLSFIRKDLATNAWTPETPGNTYPQIYRGYASLGAERSLGEVNDYYLTNVGYLRIRNLTVGYTLPASMTRRIKVQNLRIYLSGENILTWRFGKLTRYIDPEQAGSGINYNNPGDAVQRARLEDYPIGKTISAGISLTL
ncbi:MAG TPA: SusC/RagA family TonB-linked outer membrane protein, partial [Chitinophagaceae bacterium]|nr:SusC/RagA family TonB-linked outer membrane protein [Chitinophagaceae bacterium]